MSNRRKLRPLQHTVPTEIGLARPRPGERCEFHSNCCEPDDPSCAGCGKPPVKVVTFQRPTGMTRVPVCEEHEERVGQAVYGLLSKHDGLGPN